MYKVEGFDKNKALELLNSDTPDEVLEIYNTPLNIPSEKIEFYDKNGFVEIPNILTGEILAYTQKIVQAAVYLRKEHDKRLLAEKSQYEQSFLQCGYLAFDFPAVKNYVFGKRFAGLAKDLMQAKGARLWHDQALFKEADGRHTDVHQDSSYWPVAEPGNTTTMWMALNNVPVEKGCLYFYTGTHKTGIKEYVDIFKNPHHPDALNPEDKVFVPLKAGSATFHSGLTFHGARANRTMETREAMTVIYIGDGVKYDASDERNKTHKSCNGLSNGDKIDTEFTPLLK